MHNYTCEANCAFDIDVTKNHLLHHLHTGIPTKIKYNQLSILPSREDFLDPTLKNAFKKQVSLRKPLIFMPTSVHEKNEWDNGINRYRIYLFGVLPCGSKTCIVLMNVEVYVDVMVPTNVDIKEYDNVLRGQLNERNLKFTHIADILQFRLHGFQKEKRPYKRIYFHNLQDRKKVIEFIIYENRRLKFSGLPKIETAADDLGKNNYYFSKVARDLRFNTANWNRIEKYEVSDPRSVTTNCSYVLRVDACNFKKLDQKRHDELIKIDILSNVIDRDPTEVCMWDIETYRTIQNGLVPTITDNDFTIFMMCSVYFWHHSDKSILGVCVVDHACNARKGIGLIIECGTEKNVLEAHMEVVSRMAPDIVGAFNGGNFDWPLYKEKLSREGLLVKLKSKFSSLRVTTTGKYAESEESVSKWNFLREEVKIDAETKHVIGCVANFPGMLDTDVMPVFLKLYPRAEVRKSASLNFFLAKNGLESKEDMPFKRMFKIYERAIKLANVKIKSCHCGTLQKECECCKEREKMLDFQPLKSAQNMESTDEYTNNLYEDLLNTENGEKCCWCGKKQRNLCDFSDVGYYCIIDCIRPQQLYIKRCIIPDKRELSTMSFVSLYDSFYRADGMKVCNLIGSYCYKRDIAFSNLRINKDKSEKDHYPGAWVFPPNRGLHSDGYINIEEISPDGKKVQTRMRCRPITGLDFASLYPSLMMAYNLSPDMIVYNRTDAEQLISEGYTLHHIEPFKFERGATKGDAANKHYVAEGWVVRHNGIYTNKNKKTIIGYIKYINYGYIEDDIPFNIKYAEKDGPTKEQKEKLEQVQKSGKVTRKILYEPIYGRDTLPGEHMGIFSLIEKKLFDKRAPIKAENARLVKIKEQMDATKVKTWTVKNSDGTETVLDYKNDILFNINKIESKQKAIKILANTFYGKSGDYTSSIYELLVAAGITCAGQRSIKTVAAYVANRGFKTHYGDTDSLYLSCPDTVYEQCDKKYDEAMTLLAQEFDGVAVLPEPVDGPELEYKKRRVALRITWWEEMVSITMKIMNQLQEEITDFLLEDNGTLFLNMMKEEVGFPTVLCGKKKYFMCPHISKINFYPKDIFIRGIDIVKQGQAKISKQLGEEFMREALSPENERELIDIAEDKIRKFYKMKLDPALFALSAKYRPNKRNVPVLTFVARMMEMRKKYEDDPLSASLYEPPEAGDKFEYVIVKKEQRFTLQGRKIELKKGDQMEFMRVYKASQTSANPMELDLNYYIKNSIVGIFARFIAYHPKFQPPAGTYDITQYTEMDKFCIDKASKYLKEMCDSITGFDKTILSKKGRDYRKIYSHVDRTIKFDIAMRYGGVSAVICEIDIGNEDKSVTDYMIEQMVTYAKKTSPIKNTGAEFIRVNSQSQNKLSIFVLRRIFNGNKDLNVSRMRIQLCDRREQEIKDKLYQILPNVSQIIHKHEEGVISLINNLRNLKYEEDTAINENELENLNRFDPSDYAVLHNVHTLWMELISIYKIRSNVRDIVDAIEQERAKTINAPIKPEVDPRKIAYDEATRAEIIPEYNWE